MAFDRSRFLDLLAPQGGSVTLVLPVWLRANGEERVAVGAVSDGPSAKKIRDEAIKSFATSLLSGAVSHAHADRLRATKRTISVSLSAFSVSSPGV
jgi:hypothetical protein